MTIKNTFFKTIARRMPRLRDFTQHFYFSHPFLIMAGENELGGEGIRQAHEFYEKLGSSVKEKRIITTEECGEAHCQLNNFPLAQQVMFDWIEDRMK